MIIDILGYVRTEKAGQVQGLPPTSGAERVLVANLAAARVDSGGSDADEPTANLATIELARREPSAAPLYWVRAGRFDSSLHAIAGAFAAEKVWGAFFAPEWNGYRIDDDLVEPYFELFARLGRPVLVRTSPSVAARPDRVYAMARRYPRLPVVLCNGAADVHLRETVDVVQIAEERNDANLYLETSGSSVGDIVPVIRKVGAERVLFGSGARLDDEAEGARAREWLTALEEALPVTNFVKIAGGNAERLFAGSLATPAGYR